MGRKKKPHLLESSQALFARPSGGGGSSSSSSSNNRSCMKMKI